MVLNSEQNTIIEYNGNCIVNAAAGTGKTQILMLLIKKEISNNKNVMCLTFTRNVSEEFKKRLLDLNLSRDDLNNTFIGTKESFLFNEIVKPFINDALRNKGFNKINKFKLKVDYEINKKNYNSKKKQKEKLFNILFNDNIIGSYSSNKYNDIKKDDNFLLELSDYVYDNSLACKSYIKNTYSSIYIDEYQDNSKTTNEFIFKMFDSCEEMNIKLFGDKNQTIYQFLGATTSEVDRLNELALFKNSKFTLTKNYRSTNEVQEIVKKIYNSKFYIESLELYELKKIIIDNKFNFYEEKKFYKIINSFENNYVVLRSKNDKIKKDAEKLNIKYYERPQVDLKIQETNLRNIFLDILKYKCKEIPWNELKIMHNLKLNEKEFCNILNNFEKENVEKISNFFDLELNSVEQNKIFLLKDIQTFSKEKITFNVHSSQLAMTVHASKGLGFEQVIIFIEDFFYKGEFNKVLFYTAITRAKSKILFVM